MDEIRRRILTGVAAAATLAAGPSRATDDEGFDPIPPLPAKPRAGKPGDFDFLAGEWRIRHRMLTAKGWIRFEGEATCWTILKGVGSVEELRIPARDFSGMGLRMLDLEHQDFDRSFGIRRRKCILEAVAHSFCW